MADDTVPAFGASADTELDTIKESLGITTAPPDDSLEAVVPEQPPRRRRGRPPGSRNRKPEPDAMPEPDARSERPALTLSPAPLTKREEREVARRLQGILTGATGMAGIVKPYLPMTDEEAEAIASPLASYLVRAEPASGMAREILENYDLLAMTLGVGAYGVRVYHDRREEVATQRPSNTTATQVVSELPRQSDRREPDEGAGTPVILPFVSRGGTSPFEI